MCLLISEFVGLDYKVLSSDAVIFKRLETLCCFSSLIKERNDPNGKQLLISVKKEKIRNSAVSISKCFKIEPCTRKS